MRIPADLYAELLAHGREEAPNECCGMIATVDGRGVQLHRATNTAASPLRYEVDGRELLQISNEIEGAGHELGAIYHSHTRSPPYPSQTDINLAFYPDSLYVILGLAGEEPELRAFTIRDGEVRDAEILVE